MKVNMILSKIKAKVRFCLINRKEIKKLKNTNLTLISNDCLGCIKLHELRMRFNTPMVNLWISPIDFVKFCLEIDKYLQKDIIFITEDLKSPYPVGKMGDVIIHFTHYKTEQDALVKWNERKKRIDKDNMFFILSIKDDNQEDIIHDFNKLKYPHITFTNLNYTKLDSTFQCGKNKYGFFHGYIRNCSVKRHFDRFGFVKWFNSKGKEY